MTDGLFRESVRAVPGIDGKFDDVTIEEQLVDSAVYRYVQCPLFSITAKNDCLGCSVSHSQSVYNPNRLLHSISTRIFDVMVAPNLYGDIIS